MGDKQDIDKRTIRVLILGTGDSGKTTLVKQMRKIYSTVTEEERQGLSTPIKEAIMGYMRTLCSMSVEWHASRPECNIAAELMETALEFASAACPMEMAPQYLDKVLAIWSDEGIQKTFNYRNEYPLPENVPYFIGRAEAIAAEDYLPTWDDYIRFRMRTTGYSEEDFSLKEIQGAPQGDYRLRVTDVGGQHAERRKWMDMFQGTDIHGVIYVMGANGYDACLFEDSSVNRWKDTLQLFETLARKKMFADRTVVLFFNKYDIFEEKIKVIPVTVMFKEEWDADEDAQDPYDPEEVLTFLFRMFQKIYSAHVKTTTPAIHWHATTALDTDTIERLLANIQNDLVRTRLALTGFF
jgi:guanine nucleotide-binding protein subunit alpha